MLLRDKFWLRGHPEGRYNNEFVNTQISRMTPVEGCLYLVGYNFAADVSCVCGNTLILTFNRFIV